VIGVMGRWDEESQMWGWYIWLWLGYGGACGLAVDIVGMDGFDGVNGLGWGC